MDKKDTEIQVMEKAFLALEELDDENSKLRVIEWLIKRFGLNKLSVQGCDCTVANEVSQSEDMSPTFEMFIDLYDAANPSTDMERALVGGYWLQVQNNQETWNSFSVNKLLKDVGYGVGSISKSFDRAQDHKPALVRQTSKSGSSQQAKKTYRLTQSGIKFVEKLCYVKCDHEN